MGVGVTEGVDDEESVEVEVGVGVWDSDRVGDIVGVNVAEKQVFEKRRKYI